MERSESPNDPRHQGVPSSASKTISEPMVCSTQTMLLSCVKISTMSERTKTSFHLSIVTLEFHRVHPKQFLSLQYVWCKSCTYLAPTLTLSPNGLKQDSTRATSPSSSIRCVQNDFRAYGTFGTNLAPILRQDNDYVKTDRNDLPLEPRHLGFHRVRQKGVPSGMSKTIS